jgi:hypothetical protein
MPGRPAGHVMRTITRPNSRAIIGPVNAPAKIHTGRAALEFIGWGSEWVVAVEFPALS